MHVPSKFEQDRLWVPDGVERLTPSIVGKSLIGGKVEPVVQTRFRVHSKKYGKSSIVTVPANSDMSPAQIEDLVAIAFENCELRWEEQRIEKLGKHTPSREERLEVGHVLRDIRGHAVKREESSNDQIYYPVVKVDS